MHTDAHPRLQNAVTLLHGIRRRINFRAVQGVSRGPDQAMRAVSWQLRVGIQRNYVTHPGEDGQIPDLHRELVGVTAQELVEVQQLSPLALPTHPGIFHFVENAVPVEMVKRPNPGIGVLAIQSLDQV